MATKFHVDVEYAGPGAEHMKAGGSCDGFRFTSLRLHTAGTRSAAELYITTYNIVAARIVEEDPNEI